MRGRCLLTQEGAELISAKWAELVRRAKGQSSSTLRDRSLPVHEGRSLLAQRRWRSPTCGEGMGVASMEGVGVADHRRSYVEAILSSCPPARYIS